MNYSNMIEEKNLKKTFIIATLVSTLVGTFSGAIALHDKIEEKRQKAKQGKVDGVQDREIQDIKKKLARLEGPGDDGRSKGRGDEEAGGEARTQLAKRKREDDDDFAYSTRRSRALLEDVYEDNLRRVGQRYAIGDVITENKLQAQIITLQQTVITVLQDALLNGRNLTDIDIQKLVTAQQAARNGSLDALQDQYERQLHGRRKSLDRYDRPRLEFEATPPRRQLTLPAPTPSLFCPYGEHLQRTSWPLTNAFAPDASQRCPDCNVSLAVDTRDVWVFSTPSTPPRASRDFQMDARYVVKCHTTDGRFACVLCDRFAEMDCLCTSVDALVRHMGKAHTAEEFARDADLVEVGGAVRR